MKQPPKKRKTHKQPMTRINISISTGLLEMIDEAAASDFTSRSDIIRTGVLWYLRPQGRQLAEVDPETIIKTLRRRKMLVNARKLRRDLDGDGFGDNLDDDLG